MTQLIIYIALTLSGLSGSVQVAVFDNISDSTYCHTIEPEADKNSKDDNKSDSITSANQAFFTLDNFTPAYSYTSLYFQTLNHEAYLIRAPPYLT